jgi:hypothetical protein
MLKAPPRVSPKPRPSGFQSPDNPPAEQSNTPAHPRTRGYLGVARWKTNSSRPLPGSDTNFAGPSWPVAAPPAEGLVVDPFGDVQARLAFVRSFRGHYRAVVGSALMSPLELPSSAVLS